MLIFLWIVLSGIFLSVLFMRLTILNKKNFVQKLCFTTLVVVGLFLGGISPLPWLQYIFCGLILYFFCKRYNALRYSNFYLIFIVALSLLASSLINYIQQVSLFHLGVSRSLCKFI